jgi:hypothetical protein
MAFKPEYISQLNMHGQRAHKDAHSQVPRKALVHMLGTPLLIFAGTFIHLLYKMMCNVLLCQQKHCMYVFM